MVFGQNCVGPPLRLSVLGVERRNGGSGILLVLLAGILWATVGPAQVLAGTDVPPAALGGARILSGGLVLAVVVLATDPLTYRALTRPTWPALLAASAATATFQAAFMTAVATTGAAVATTCA
jgi:DME family drug/metabolite transporter